LVTHELHPRRAFRIARPRREPIVNVFARIEAEGISGWGEASPNAFYAETAEGVVAKLRAAAPLLASLTIASVDDITRAWRAAWEIVAPSRAAHCALDLALWDWLAQRKNITVAELAWGATAQPVRSFCTIGLSSAAELEEKIAELDGYPLIKIKSDERADLAPVQRTRTRLPAATMAVDANCAWGGHDLDELARQLAALGIAFLEQPVPPGNGLPTGKPRRLPIVADESCVTEEDVERIARDYDGCNIKLVKCGGLTPGRAMACRGRELGLKTMVGCMLESSVLIAAGAVVAQRTDYADLDGAWLIADDPFNGWEFRQGTLHPPTGVTGLGVSPVSGKHVL
jgi:L-alanine-DL-glutamate epimerase-like enolase superfamily enzyme